VQLSVSAQQSSGSISWYRSLPLLAEEAQLEAVSLNNAAIEEIQNIFTNDTKLRWVVW
jgi:hypothetical protein